MASTRKTQPVKVTQKKVSPGKKAKAPAKAASKPAKKKAAKKPTARKVAAKKPVGKKSAPKKAAPAKKAAGKTASKPAKAPKSKPAASEPAPKAKKPATKKPKAPRKPRKPVVAPELLKAIRDALVHQRNSLLSVVQSTQAQLAEKAGGLADVSDRASGGYEDDLAMGLMKIEAAKIDDIEAAIKRIDDDVYGVCADCHKAIPRKRLEILPFALRCLPCEGTKERRARMHIPSDDAD